MSLQWGMQSVAHTCLAVRVYSKFHTDAVPGRNVEGDDDPECPGCIASAEDPVEDGDTDLDSDHEEVHQVRL